MHKTDTIAAISTGAGGALSVIRISGPNALIACDAIFKASSGKKLSEADGYTLHYGEIINTGAVNSSIDDVIVSVFRAPKSYTGENMAEISCHGSRYIQQQIMQLLLQNGVRSADAGEFTLRAFLAGKLDLSQAEAVADMIASNDRATHTLAVTQMRGGYSEEFSVLRHQLLSLASLLELELDFSEEDVEFANRAQLLELISHIRYKVETLAHSFTIGNAMKEGIGVAIVGSPNVGKSTLLNTLLKDDRAMVSDIPGTTRDVIEETIVIDGTTFRFIDTAGIRETDDSLEKMGIARTYSSISKAKIVLLMVEAGEDRADTKRNIDNALQNIGTLSEDQKMCILINKTDKFDSPFRIEDFEDLEDLRGVQTLAISAKYEKNIDSLIEWLSNAVGTKNIYDGEVIVSNIRHYDALLLASLSLARVDAGISSALPTDMLVQDIREVLYSLGSITGEITNDEILESIFSKFCIGK